jgi:hypothetical protein
VILGSILLFSVSMSVELSPLLLTRGAMCN